MKLHFFASWRLRGKNFQRIKVGRKDAKTQGNTRKYLLVLVVLISQVTFGQPADCAKNIIDTHGAIIRGDTCKKQMAIVLTGDEFADGGTVILKILAKHQVKASFFLTGNFYRNPDFKSLIVKLKKDKHYLGAHSDKHLLYNDWTKRDSLLVTESEFKNDLRANYDVMKSFGVRRSEAVYFIPPYEWYNSTISRWAKDMGLQLINFSPGTRSTADYTYPEMGSRYKDSNEIYKSIFDYESRKGLNGFILLIHIGTDPRRTDKFYFRLDELFTVLKQKGYTFSRINELLE